MFFTFVCWCSDNTTQYIEEHVKVSLRERDQLKFEIEETFTDEEGSLEIDGIRM